MGWEPTVHRVVRKGRKPYYTLQVNRHCYHLGIDRKVAYERAAKLLENRPASSAPQTVAGLILAWSRETGGTISWVSRWGQLCGSKRLIELSHTDLQEFADYLKTQSSEHTYEPLSAWTVRKYVATVRKMWRWAFDRGWVPCMPGKASTQQPVLRPRDLPVPDVRDKIEKLNPRAKLIATFMLETGCRPSEARLLKWEHVNTDANVCVLSSHKASRTGNLRTIPLSPPAIAVLGACPRINEWVFNTLRGKPYTKDGLHSVLERAGISSAYAFRHTFAQWFLDHGGEDGTHGDKSELQAWLGHSDGRMTDIYAQVRNTRLRDVAKRITGPLAQ